MAIKISGVQNLDVFQEEKEGKLREVGSQAVWSLSSCKPGFGVEQLRDDSNDTYWQSDGPQPHLINIQFRRKTTIHDVCLYGDYKADESYTPNRLSIRAGNHFNDLGEVEQVELSEPQGWVSIPLRDLEDKPLRTFMIQIAVLSNHQNGRDTHIRRIKVRSPVQDFTFGKLPNFTSWKCYQFSTIR
ncbi:anaphase-promoting complex subunit 10-like [Liolophura sinensis]|uniref:anaphase-promoting complex subunit 10-like n=1 Tax=Liolophura sinensis TaxID=3198878 RepID=UPI00315814D3